MQADQGEPNLSFSIFNWVRLGQNLMPIFQVGSSPRLANEPKILVGPGPTHEHLYQVV